MMLGKANYYKHDPFTALEAFEYVAKEYSNYPIKIDALIWIVRCYNEIGNFEKSQEILDILQNEKKIPPTKFGNIAEVYADFYLKQKEYNLSKKHLQLIIQHSKKKYPKARASFILAQINQQENNL